jgi:hypothetical protein
MKKGYTKKIKKGGCGCSGTTPIMTGGARKRRQSKKLMKGGNTLGPASLTNYDPSNEFTYSLNTFNNDPTAPASLIDTRQLPNSAFFSGGRRRSIRKRKGTRSRRSYRKLIKGGDQFIQSYNVNSLSNFATNSSAGSLIGAEIVSGNPITGLDQQSLELNKPFI